MNTKINLLILMLIFFGCSYDPSEFDIAIKKYEAQDYKTAFNLFIPLAREGNPKAQFYIGVMYYFGNGIEQDSGKAFEWTIKAAEQNHPAAQYNIAQMYYFRGTTDEDKVLAFKYLEKAAETDLSPAQVNLATCYISGEGTSKDFNKGLALLKKAAVQNDPNALTRLGTIYYHGNDIRKNDEVALKYFYQAMLHEEFEDKAEMQYLLGHMYLDGKVLKKDKEMGNKLIVLAAKKSITAQMYIGLLSLELGEKDAAKKMFDRAEANGVSRDVINAHYKYADILKTDTEKGYKLLGLALDKLHEDRLRCSLNKELLRSELPSFQSRGI